MLLKLIKERFGLMLLIGACIGAIAGSVAYHYQPQLRSAWVNVTLTDSDAAEIQNTNVSQHLKAVYANQAGIPTGDLTDIAIRTGAFHPFIPDVPFDTIANERVRQSMAQLQVDQQSGRVWDKRGRPVKVMANEGMINVQFGS